MAAAKVAIETRGTRLLRDLERAYRSLSPAQQRSMIATLRDLSGGVTDSPEPPLAEAAGAA